MTEWQAHARFKCRLRVEKADDSWRRDGPTAAGVRRVEGMGEFPGSRAMLLAEGEVVGGHQGQTRKDVQRWSSIEYRLTDGGEVV